MLVTLSKYNDSCINTIFAIFSLTFPPFISLYSLSLYAYLSILKIKHLETCETCLRYFERSCWPETDYARRCDVHDDWNRYSKLPGIQGRIAVCAGTGEGAKCVLFAGSMFRLSKLHAHRSHRSRRIDMGIVHSHRSLLQ